MSERFRPTLWPGDVIPVPRIIPVTDVEIVDGVWVTWINGTPEDAQALPDEFYLREAAPFDFYTEDIEGVAALVERYGVPFEADYQEWAGGGYYEWEQRLIAADLRGDYEGDQEIRVRTPGMSLHLLEAQTHFDAIRFLREAWVECAETGSMENYARLHRVSEKETRASFLETLNKGLRLAHAKAVNPEAPEELATIYGACCLQVYNHIAENAQFKRCANESCRQVFVRQRGRSQQGQRRTEGIRFCSRECARAQAQRELRRRKKYGDQEAARITQQVMDSIEDRERRYLTVSTNSQIPEVGQIYKEAREAAGISTSSLAEDVHLPEGWVTAMEDGRFDDFANGAEHTVRGDLRKIARHLGVDVGPALAIYERRRLEKG